MALGDRLLLARILLKALDAKELDEEQCERLFGLDRSRGPVLLPGEQQRLEAIAGAPTLEPDIQADLSRSLASVDAKERSEALRPSPQKPIDIGPIEPVAPGANLLDDPEDFVAKVARRRSRQMGR